MWILFVMMWNLSFLFEPVFLMSRLCWGDLLQHNVGKKKSGLSHKSRRFWSWFEKILSRLLRHCTQSNAGAWQAVNLTGRVWWLWRRMMEMEGSVRQGSTTPVCWLLWWWLSVKSAKTVLNQTAVQPSLLPSTVIDSLADGCVGSRAEETLRDALDYQQSAHIYFLRLWQSDVFTWQMKKKGIKN